MLVCQRGNQLNNWPLASDMTSQRPFSGREDQYTMSQIDNDGEFELSGGYLTSDSSVRVALVCGDGFDTTQLSILTSLYITSRSFQVLPHFEMLGMVINGSQPPKGFESAFGQSIPVYQDLDALISNSVDLELVLFAGGGTVPLPKIEGVRCLNLESVESFMQILMEKMANDGIFHQTERVFGSVIDQLNEEFLVLSPDGIIKNLNKAVLSNIGGKKADYIGKHCRDVEGEDFCPISNTDINPLEECLRQGRPIERDVSTFTKSGEVRYFRVHATPIFSERGDVVRVFLMRRNVTQRVILEQQSKIAERLSTEMKLLHQLTHEVRNPLFVIGGFAGSLLRTPNMDASVRNKAQAILDESRRLDELLSRLSDALKPISPKLGVVNVNETLRELLEDYKHRNIQESIVFKADLNHGLPKGLGDATLFAQCVSQLIDNSIASMPDGGSIVLRSRQIESLIKVQVVDTGKGIPPEDVSQLFNPLLRPKREGGGLIRVKKAIEEMGGSIDVQSIVDRGTTMTLSLMPSSVPQE